eukprot:3501046-Prymnesium_polylepis.1
MGRRREQREVATAFEGAAHSINTGNASLCTGRQSSSAGISSVSRLSAAPCATRKPGPARSDQLSTACRQPASGTHA